MEAPQPDQVAPQLPVETASQAPATPEIPMPTEQQVPESRSAGKAPSLLVAVVGLVIFLLLGTVALAAANMGRGNVFSQLAAFIPVENIPLLNALGRSKEEMVREVLPTTAEHALSRDYGSEWSSSLAIFGNATALDQQNIGIDLHLNGKTAGSANMEKSRAEYTVGGSVSSGVMKVDLGQSGLTYTMLMPNPNDFFFAVNLSDQMSSTIEPYLQAYNQQLQFLSAEGGPAFNVNDLFNTYWKLDMREYMKFMNEQMGEEATTEYDFQRYQRAAENLASEIGPQVRRVYATTLGNIPRWAKVQDLGREKVSGKAARVMGIEIANESVPPVALEFIEGMIEVVKTNPEPFRTFCKDVSTTDAERDKCDQDFSQEELDALTMSEDDKNEFQDGLREMLNMLTFSNVKLYISPVDNTLLKYETTIEASSNARAAMSEDGMTWEKLGVTVMGEELSRGQDFAVETPTEYKDFIEVMRAVMAAQSTMMQGLGASTLIDDPSTGSMLNGDDASQYISPEVQQYMQDPAYQEMMLQYYGGNAGDLGN